MINVIGLAFTLLVAGKKPTTWIVDGNNVLGQKGTPRDRETLIQRLKPIADEASENLVLVFDGQRGQGRTEEEEGLFRSIQLEEGVSADDFILQEIRAIAESSTSNRVKLVTGDKRLRSFALHSRPTVKTIINPLTFWKKYRPRMSGLKKRDQTIEIEEDA